MDHDPDDAGSLKSDGSNYLLWSYMMRNFKIEEELWHLAIGSVGLANPKSIDYFNLRKELESMNAKALSIINSLEMEIEGVKQSGFPITVLYCYLQCYWYQLAEMEPMELSDLESYKKYRKETRLVQLLMALPDKFEPIRKSMLQRSSLPSVSEAVQELLDEEQRLTYSQLSSLSLEDKDNSKTGSDECLYCHQTGHLKADCPATKKNDHPCITDSILQSEEDYEPSSSSSRLASSLTPDNNQPALSTDLSGLSSPASGKYLPPFRRDLCSFQSLVLAILYISYNLYNVDGAG
uniref:CCHC-type domain-containing protein n=1 Tax=Fagus sylvatica TaxID=28930 RepID=A0A2N9I4X3_FAGSY